MARMRAAATRYYGITQIVIAVAGVEAYELLRHAMTPNWAVAERHAQDVLSLEQFSNIDIGSPTSASFSNPVAAVPSLHAGWAVGVGVGLVLYAGPRIWKAVGVAYPIAVILTTIVT